MFHWLNFNSRQLFCQKVIYLTLPHDRSTNSPLYGLDATESDGQIVTTIFTPCYHLQSKGDIREYFNYHRRQSSQLPVGSSLGWKVWSFEVGSLLHYSLSLCSRASSLLTHTFTWLVQLPPCNLVRKRGTCNVLARRVWRQREFLRFLFGRKNALIANYTCRCHCVRAAIVSLPFLPPAKRQRERGGMKLNASVLLRTFILMVIITRLFLSLLVFHFDCVIWLPSTNWVTTAISSSIRVCLLSFPLPANWFHLPLTIATAHSFSLLRPTNYSLGVGVNKIRLVVVDISHTQPWVINVYTLSIERSDIFAKEPKFNPSIEHEICSLKQVSDLLPFFPFLNRPHPCSSCFTLELVPVVSYHWPVCEWVTLQLKTLTRVTILPGGCCVRRTLDFRILSPSIWPGLTHPEQNRM